MSFRPVEDKCESSVFLECQQPIVNILEGLINWVVDQFLSMMEYCTDMDLTGQSLLTSCNHCSTIMLKALEKSGELSVSKNTKRASGSWGNILPVFKILKVPVWLMLLNWY